MIGVIDCNLGNIGSVVNMLSYIGHPARVVNTPEHIRQCERLIFPGVGAFDTAVRNLQDSGFYAALHEAVREERKPILGICVGAQLFCSASEEGKLDGLGWINAKVRRFDTSKVKHIPHLGWNTVSVQRNDPLYKDVLDTYCRFYFLHSYYIELGNDTLCETQYGDAFTSSFRHQNVWGVQFHPEKSHRYGMKLLKNFCEMPCDQE